MNQFDQLLAAMLIQAGGSIVITKDTIQKIDPRGWIETELPNPKDGSVKITYCTEHTSTTTLEKEGT